MPLAEQLLVIEEAGDSLRHTMITGFDEPWRLLAGYIPSLKVRQLGAGTGYLAYGHTPLH